MKNSFEKPRHPDHHHGNRQTEHRNQRPIKQRETGKQEAQEKHQRMKQEDILAELEKQIDEDASNIGLVIASVFKTMSVAHGMLPNMNLKTDRFHIVVNEACISVNVFDPECVKCPGFPGCFDDGDDNDFDDDFDHDFSDEYGEEEEDDEFED